MTSMLGTIRPMIKNAADTLAHWRCVLQHRPHWFSVAGLTLCRICDAHLLETIIQGAANTGGADPNALTELADGADRGLRNT